jgi:hypothetical protein
MPVKTLRRPDGTTLRFGRKQPRIVYPHLKLGNYLTAALPPPPATVDYSRDANSALAKMYLNDTLGDCVIACVGHDVGVFTGNADNPDGGFLLTDAQIEALYSAACGYVPGNPNTDDGCEIQSTLTFWQQNGAPIGSTHKIAGMLAVDPTNLAEVQTAIWLFENVIFGVALPDAWVNPPPSASGFVWDIAGAPDPNNGHCFPAMSYNTPAWPNTLMIATWAMTGFITPAAMAYYAASAQGGELWTVVSQDTINSASQLAPSGVNWSQMVADFNAMGGTVTPPSPTPTPTPTLTPPSDPVPGSAQWLSANLSHAAYMEYVASLTSMTK